MPDKGRRIAISDIHGCGDTFEALLENQLCITTVDSLYLLGDFIDRGPNSKKTIDLIFSYSSKGYSIQCLMGNHEDMMLRGKENPYYHDIWSQINGGITTLASFGVNHVLELPEVYMNFFHNLHFYFSLSDYLLVHAGFNFKSPNPFMDYESMLWIRDYKVDLNKTNNRKVVHGHTPIAVSKIIDAIDEDQPNINIDNGCAYPKEGLQGLIALDLDTLEIWRQPNIETV